MKTVSAIILAFIFSAALYGATYTAIELSGQSLAVGYCASGGSCGPISTSQPYSNKMLQSFVSTVASPLTESTYESPLSGICNELTFLSPAQTLNFICNNSAVNGVDYSVLGPYGSGPEYGHVIGLMSNSVTWAGLNSNTINAAYCVLIHGQTDEAESTSAIQYETDMAEYQNHCSLDAQSRAGNASVPPLFIDQCSSWPTYSPNHATPTACLGIERSARDYPGLIILCTPDYQYARSDNVHLTNAGYLNLGETMGYCMDTQIRQAKRWKPVMPYTINISGAVITAVFYMPSGCLTTDTTTIPDKGNGKGFEFFDDSGSTPVIDSVSFPSCNTATITLHSTPTGTTASQQLAYAYTGTPGATAGTTAAANGNIRSDATITSQSGGTIQFWMVTFREPVNGFHWYADATKCCTTS